ncbi:MAG: hypothetical protein WCB80_32230 [Mycobacterium sp.]
MVKSILPSERSAMSCCRKLASGACVLHRDGRGPGTGTGTGKSTYLAVLINQLQLLCETLGASMEPATRATADAYARHYEAPLYAQRGLVAPTPTMQDLAAAPARIPDFLRGSRRGRRRFVVIRDAAGEDLESADLHARPSATSATRTRCSSCLTPCESRRSAISCMISCRTSPTAAVTRAPS